MDTDFFQLYHKQKIIYLWITVNFCVIIKKNKENKMKNNYQPFLISACLLIAANYWHFFSNNFFFSKSFDYIAYGFFIFGLYKLLKQK